MKNLLLWFLKRLKFLLKSFVLRKKIHGIWKKVRKLDNFSQNIINIEQHKKYWSNFGRINTKWYEVYTTFTQQYFPEYIPENIYYLKIEPVMNTQKISLSYTDKNLYDLRHQSVQFPKTILRNIDGVFYGTDFGYIKLSVEKLNDLLVKHSKLIVKPSLDSGGGQNVKYFFRRDGVLRESITGEELSPMFLEIYYKTNFLIQEFIEQDNFFKNLNESSLNTVRILTYRSLSDNTILPIHQVLRIGRPGSITDNQASGGIAWGLNKFGKLSEYGVDKYGRKYLVANGNDLSGLTIPKWEEFIESALTVAKDFYYDRLLGIDLCLDQNQQIIIVEVNNNSNEINFFQMTGGPLFGTYTEEIRDYCNNSIRSGVVKW